MVKNIFVVATAMISTTMAFPNILEAARRSEQLKWARGDNGGIASGKGTVPDPAVAEHNFNAKAQYISTSGKYSWKAPGKTDQRGPCPGLNAMANHGYIPHNGIATIQQFITATNTVFGMGLDLAAFLAVYGALFDGNLGTWSIGGPDSRVSLGPLLGLHDEPSGLSGSHNNYESDVSPTRGDLYQYGDDYTARPEQFAELWNYQGSLSNEESNFNLEVLQTFRSARWDASLNENPYFFSAVFAGLLVQPAAFTFMYRFMANHSAEHPDGVLSQDVLKSFFAMEGPHEDGTFTNTHGHERIPDNWYRRAIGSEYTIPFFLLDVLQEAAVYPKFLSLGGNTGTVNSFSGVDPADLSGGVYNAKTLAEGNNLQCFVFQFLLQDGPDFLASIYETAFDAISTLTEAVTNATVGINCPKLEKGQNGQFDKFPGYTRSGGVSKRSI